MLSSSAGRAENGENVEAPLKDKLCCHHENVSLHFVQLQSLACRTAAGVGTGGPEEKAAEGVWCRFPPFLGTFGRLF